MRDTARFLQFFLISARVLAANAARAAEPLPSWNDGPAKSRIVGFVQAVSDKASKDYVAPADRIAVFDNDGTLWSEQPAYFQLAFAIDRVKAMAPKYPQWKKQQPFKAALEGDMKALAASGERGLMTLVMATHAGLTTDEFAAIARDWLATAKEHPKFKRAYDELVFQTMLEVLDYLRANGFKTYIVSGGGVGPGGKSPPGHWPGSIRRDHAPRRMIIAARGTRGGMLTTRWNFPESPKPDIRTRGVTTGARALRAAKSRPVTTQPQSSGSPNSLAAPGIATARIELCMITRSSSWLRRSLRRWSR